MPDISKPRRRLFPLLSGSAVFCLCLVPMARPAAFFTEAGLNGLRHLVQDRRAMDHERYGYLRRELGVDDLSDGEG